MSVRLRYTLLYGMLFAISGTGLIAIMATLSIRVSRPADGLVNAQLSPAVADELEMVAREQDRRLMFGALVAMVVMVLVALLMGRAAAGTVLRPLRKITAATRRISADSLHRRLAVRGPADEVKALADTIDDLLGRLEESFAAQRRFVADASHELRTPLATMRAAVDVAEAKPAAPSEVGRLAGRVRAELDQLERLLEGLLVLARAQHGALDGRMTLSVRSLIPAGTPVAGDDFVTIGNPVLLARMVSNVVGNAVRHGEPGGWRQVTLSPGVLVVENDGPVLEPAEVETLGRPFRRLGTARTTSGAIAGPSDRVGAIAAPREQAAAIATLDKREEAIAAPSEPAGTTAGPGERAGAIGALSERAGAIAGPSERAGAIAGPSERTGAIAVPSERAGAGADGRMGAGTGLGLAIASAVASAHGGSLVCRARAAGGLRVEIRLPVQRGEGSR
ncbi:sensor histidine kinase [Actinoplanes sp. CA-054009]